MTWLEVLMSHAALVKRLSDKADELLCRISNGRVDLFTELGKRVLPDGYWGASQGEYGAKPSLLLTFDDGPHPSTTPMLLELLAQQGVKATFFLVGSNCRRYPALVQRIHAAGHTLGNHTYNHVLLPFLQRKQLQEEVVRTNHLIEDLTGEPSRLFRPPYGLMDERTAACLKQQSMSAVYWGAAPEDWLTPGSKRIVRRVMWRISDGTLIVLHEGEHLCDQTISATREIISRSKLLGYQFSQVNVRA
jgi:peptidoglycan-N-acetylglucosamine deacetylase